MKFLKETKRRIQAKTKSDPETSKAFLRAYAGGPLKIIHRANEIDFKVFSRAAVIIQKFIRGFIVRKKLAYQRTVYLKRAQTSKLQGIKTVPPSSSKPRLTNSRLSVQQKYLLECANKNDLDGIKKPRFDINPSDINCFDDKRRSPLQICVMNLYNKIAFELIGKGADVNYRGANGHSALHLAFLHQNFEFIDYLVQHHFKKTNFYITDFQGKQPHEYFKIQRDPRSIKAKDIYEKEKAELEFKRRVVALEKWFQNYSQIFR